MASLALLATLVFLGCTVRICSGCASAGPSLAVVRNLLRGRPVARIGRPPSVNSLASESLGTSGSTRFRAAKELPLDPGSSQPGEIMKTIAKTVGKTVVAIGAGTSAIAAGSAIHEATRGKNDSMVLVMPAVDVPKSSADESGKSAQPPNPPETPTYNVVTLTLIGICTLLATLVLTCTVCSFVLVCRWKKNGNYDITVENGVVG